MTVNVRANKKVVAVIFAMVALGIVLIGTFAWRSFNQRARNVFQGFMQPEVNLHDDFWEPNKDVYVENPGEKTIYVRVSFKEFMEVNKNSLYQSSTYEDADSWQKHYNPQEACPVDDCGLEFHTFYKWIMGQGTSDPDKGWKWYIPAPESARAKYDDDGNYIEGSSKTVYGIDYETLDENGKESNTAQVSETGHTYAQVIAAMPNDTQYQNLLTAYQGANEATKAAKREELDTYAFDKWGVKLTETTAQVMTMADWKSAGSKTGPYWVMDTDGWFYWAEGLKADSATGLLLSEVNLAKKPDSDWFYAVDVYLNAVTEDDFNSLGSLGLTGDAMKLLYLATGDYIDSGLTDNGTTIWYKSLGQNVYEQGTVLTIENGTSQWNRTGVFSAGASYADVKATNAADKFVKVASESTGWVSGDTANNKFTLTLGTDLGDVIGGKITFAGEGSYTILDIKQGVDNIWYFDLGDGMYMRALKSTESMNVGGVTSGDGLLGGAGPHMAVWVPEGATLGGGDMMTSNPEFTLTGGRIMYHVGNGVYYEAKTAKSAEPKDDPIIYYVSSADRDAIELMSDTSKFLVAGSYYTLNKTEASGYEVAQASDTGAFKIVDIVKGVDIDKYYLKIDYGRKNGDGTPYYAYYAVGADDKLGGKDDVRTWAGTNGIGTRNDTTTEPSYIPSNISVGSQITLGKFYQTKYTTTDLGKNPTEDLKWDVLDIQGSKVMIQTHDAIYAMNHNPSGNNSGSWVNTSDLRVWLNTEFVDKAFGNSTFNSAPIKQQIVFSNLTTDQDGANRRNAKSNDYVFHLSSQEINKYFPTAESRKLLVSDYAKSINANTYWGTRNHVSYYNVGNYVPASGTNVSASPARVNYARPAMWIEFNSTKWGTYGTPGTGGTWKQTGYNTGVKTWIPGVATEQDITAQAY